MANFKILKIIIIFFSFLLLLLLNPLKAEAQQLSITYYLSGNDIQIIYLPGPVKVNKVNIYACSVQNRNGGFQLGIALLYEGIQVAYKGTTYGYKKGEVGNLLSYARSGCPMWSFGGTAEGTALDFGGTSADAIQIVPVLGNGSYAQMFVSYEEGAGPLVIQCGAENTIRKFADFSVPWLGSGNFSLPATEKIHLVNLYGCCDQNRGGGCSDDIALLYNSTQVAYKGKAWGGIGGQLRFGRSGCPMWAFARSPTASALNFGGVLANTIRAVPTPGWRAGARIYRIFYTHEPEQCNQASPTADIKANPITIAYNTSATISWTSTNASTCSVSPTGWSGTSNPGVSTGNLTSSQTYTLSCSGPGGSASDNVTVNVTPFPNQPPSASNLQVSQPDYCIISWPAAIFSWQFTDPDGDTQSAYQIQVDDNSDFSSPEVDTGKILSSSNSYATLPGKISWNTTYYWQLTVWDSKDWLSADWIVYQNNVPPAESFNTPRHQYPTINFSWAPQNPSTNEQVQFTDQSIVYGGSTKSSWSWTFQDGNPANSAQQNPIVKFLSAGAKSVTLRVTDSDGFSCQAQKTINSQLPLPEWIEIPPF